MNRGDYKFSVEKRDNYYVIGLKVSKSLKKEDINESKLAHNLEKCMITVKNIADNNGGSWNKYS